MNAEQLACASSGKASTWEQIDWLKCERQVRRLQARIVKAKHRAIGTLQRRGYQPQTDDIYNEICCDGEEVLCLAWDGDFLAI